MGIKQTFSFKEKNFKELKKSFSSLSAIKISDLFSEKLCNQSISFILKNESEIIKNYKNDKRGLVSEKVDNNYFIKYFDKPLFTNFKLFSKFINSDVFNIASNLLDEEVFLHAFEIHSRFALGTQIPAHQDNAYYGLNSGKSLTFYISLNPQYASKGGLIYYKIPIGNTKMHKPSDLPGFSLTIKDNYHESLDTFKPDFKTGDCTIHHSSSIHYALDVPENSDRVLVIRLTLHAINEFTKKGHNEWYEKIVGQNRNKSIQ